MAQRVSVPPVSAGLELLRQVRRVPDAAGPTSSGIGPADLLILDEALHRYGPEVERITVLDDNFGALTLGAAELFPGAKIISVTDSIAAERAIAANAERLGLRDKFELCALEPGVFAGTVLVLARLQRARAALAYAVQVMAAGQDISRGELSFVGGGMQKHLNLGLNQELSRYFREVSASLGRAKARVIHAGSPVEVLPDAARYPLRTHHDRLGFDVFAYGAVFGRTSLDQGTALLCDYLINNLAVARPNTVVDLGCGSGILTTLAARTWPNARVLATDVSAQAVAATALTTTHAHVADRVSVSQDDAGGQLPDRCADLVLCNPPFHDGGHVVDEIALRMFASAARVLRPGGQLICVYNTTLHYFGPLQRLFGEAQVVANDSRFTVTAARRRAE